MTKVVVLLGLVAGIGLYAAALRHTDAPERRITTRPIGTGGNGFTSSQPCKACHPSEYDAWHTSYHRTMTQVATPETVKSDFNDVIVDAVHGRSMRLQRRDRELWAEFDDPDWNPRADPLPTRIQRRVVMTTGSHNQEVYWYETGHGRRLGQLPGTYIIAERRWIPRSMVFLAPPQAWPSSTTGYWNEICINCHTTNGRPRLQPSTASDPKPSAPDTQVAEFGIACEACHGPSDAHTSLNQNPVRRYALHLTRRADTTTVQPVRLDPKASSQVCGQCHGIWMLRDHEQTAADNGPTYRPGEEISATRLLVRPSDTAEPLLRKRLQEYPDYLRALFWNDGMVRVSGREYNGLVESPCYKNATDSARTMSCFSCHAMHTKPDDPRSPRDWALTHQVSPDKVDNRACVQCHPKFAANVTAHTKHVATSEGSSCYNCHMPYTSYGLLKALRSHTISSPTVAETVQTGRPNACNLCHLDKTLEWTSNELERMYGTPKLPLSDDERTIAASLLWALRGDAGQRALTAWAMGWQPAQQASGTEWMPAFLSGFFDDPYDAVRFIAYRSMRSMPGFNAFNGDFIAAPAVRRGHIQSVIDQWRRTSMMSQNTARQNTARLNTARRNTDALLLRPDGSLNLDIITRLLSQRDNRPLRLNE